MPKLPQPLKMKPRHTLIGWQLKCGSSTKKLWRVNTLLILMIYLSKHYVSLKRTNMCVLHCKDVFNIFTSMSTKIRTGCSLKLPNYSRAKNTTYVWWGTSIRIFIPGVVLILKMYCSLKSFFQRLLQFCSKKTIVQQKTSLEPVTT